jgi:hypothetical protein
MQQMAKQHQGKEGHKVVSSYVLLNEGYLIQRLDADDNNNISS